MYSSKWMRMRMETVDPKYEWKKTREYGAYFVCHRLPFICILLYSIPFLDTHIYIYKQMCAHGCSQYESFVQIKRRLKGECVWEKKKKHYKRAVFFSLDSTNAVAEYITSHKWE